MNPISALDALKLYRDLLIEGSLQVTDKSWLIPDVSSGVPQPPPLPHDEDGDWFDLNFTPEF
jgi:hypothetical protein